MLNRINKFALIISVYELLLKLFLCILVTLVVVVSKTFTTAETMLNARTLREWITAALGLVFLFAWQPNLMTTFFHSCVAILLLGKRITIIMMGDVPLSFTLPFWLPSISQSWIHTYIYMHVFFFSLCTCSRGSTHDVLLSIFGQNMISFIFIHVLGIMNDRHSFNTW